MRTDLTEAQLDGTGCIHCGSDDAPHRGETITTRVAPGVVRDTTVARCTPCLKASRRPQNAEANR